MIFKLTFLTRLANWTRPESNVKYEVSVDADKNYFATSPDKGKKKSPNKVTNQPQSDINTSRDALDSNDGLKQLRRPRFVLVSCDLLPSTPQITAATQAEELTSQSGSEEDSRGDINESIFLDFTVKNYDSLPLVLRRPKHLNGF